METRAPAPFLMPMYGWTVENTVWISLGEKKEIYFEERGEEYALR